MHLMNDIETIGTDADTIVLSVGSVLFNKEGIHAKREWTLDLEEQKKLGRTFDHETLWFWMKQSEGARKAFDPKIEKVSMVQFLNEYELWIDENLVSHKEKRDELKCWGNGSSFDTTIIEDLFRKYHSKGKAGIPWKFWNQWCYRTFNHLTKAKDLVKREGIYHNAADDAEFQAKTVLAFWNKQAGKKK